LLVYAIVPESLAICKDPSGECDIDQEDGNFLIQSRVFTSQVLDSILGDTASTADYLEEDVSINAASEHEGDLGYEGDLGSPECQKCYRHKPMHEKVPVYRKCSSTFRTDMETVCSDECKSFLIESDADSEDDIDRMIGDLARHEKGSREECHKCKSGIDRMAIMKQCEKEVHESKTSTCMMEKIGAQCGDACTYGSPCANCKRNKAWNPKAVIFKTTFSHCIDDGMKALCPEQCSDDGEA
jgi:hypothetical protein